DATRRPDASRVHTGSPERSASTAISPTGVAIFVPRARQIGHGGELPGSCAVTVMVPSVAIVPATRVTFSEALESGPTPPNGASKLQPSDDRVRVRARIIFHAR